MGLKRMIHLAGAFRDAVKRQGVRAIPAIVKKYLLSTRLGSRFALRGVTGKVVRAAEIAHYRQSFRVALPQGWPARAVEVTLSVPAIPPRPHFEFADHPLGSDGEGSETVVASAMGGFGVSHDLGLSWKYVKVPGQEDRRILHAKQIAPGNYLLQATERLSDRSLPRSIDILVADETGRLLVANRLAASPWHGCRSVDCAGGVVMYAEYPFEVANATPEQRDASRVWRSRDMGASWEVVFEARDIRHFHFIQARPGHAGEWWLTSGDGVMESRVYVSKDDGASWHDTTASYGTHLRFGASEIPRTLFRLTDLAWVDDDAVWGTDDYLYSVRGTEQGARMFRAACADVLVPQIVGRGRWQIRNMVEVGDFFFVLTQGCNRADATPEEKRPGAFLMPKRAPAAPAPAMVHLFDVPVHSQVRTGFTYSRASRAAKDGTFFTYRASTDAFPSGHKMLKWEVGWG